MHSSTVLIIGFTWPEPTSTAAGKRMLQLLNFFIQQKYRTVFASTAGETNLSLDLEDLGIEKAVIKLNDPGFDTYIKNLDPDIVVFDRFLTEEQFGWRVAEFVPNAIRILDTEDLHSLRLTRQEQFKKDLPFTIAAWLQNDTTKREIASIYRCDLSLIISSFELQLLIETLQIDENLLLHLPFMVENTKASQERNRPSFASRRDFVCIGNGKHAPNIDAIHWLKKDIWPLIRSQLPEVNLHIYGAYLPEYILNMANSKEGFYVEGWTENAEKVLREARIGLAPLRFGAGIKGKLVDAMQSGTPTITTSIGAEGMHGDYPWNGAIKDSAKEFATAAVQLYQDHDAWEQAQENGEDILHAFYDKHILEKKLKAALCRLSDTLETHRNSNFTGAMLLHHSMASTKYMAKWIRAKNKI